jgi:SAM-dependent methyltransferase
LASSEVAELYDRIGLDYTSHRQPDSRIAEAILRELGDARTVVNVGAGAGAYEPSDRRVLAVEPASTMIGQRPRGAPPAIRAHAEALPFADATFDAAMAVLSDHHWVDRAAGLRELRRVARRAVVFTWDPSKAAEGWIVRDYLTEFGRRAEVRMSIEEIAGHLGGARILPVPVPHDCSDGFFHAYWRRPHAYLDPDVRACISVFSFLDQAATAHQLDRLRDDLQTGRWHERNRDILDKPELDLGYRLLTTA